MHLHISCHKVNLIIIMLLFMFILNCNLEESLQVLQNVELCPSFISITSSCWKSRVERRPMCKMVCKLNLIKKALKKLNAESFYDLHNSDTQAYNRLIQCHTTLQTTQVRGSCVMLNKK